LALKKEGGKLFENHMFICQTIAKPNIHAEIFISLLMAFIDDLTY
jgi:hypothetical protein